MVFLLILTSYILGNFLPALQIGRRKGMTILAEGSGNPGARNVGRVFGKRAFLCVFLLDAGKGALAVFIAFLLDGRPVIELLALAVVMLGHCYPIVHRFNGGKGAATFIGGLLVFHPIWILPILLGFVVLYPAIKKFTAASVLATIAIVPCSIWLYDEKETLIALSIVGLLLWTHRADLHISKGRNYKR
ncbi:glycerol-3-phosphate acyltransferase [Sporosarcina sp. BI001-red]|uniref:glycerol-3-phosphate acyltransferase n=1 Tax=Sporosarcina sp. BI001-red TaxID=2282866 RepID=UPI000E282E54|nr:glycerol-3-phosphate acyltransferase [Sporosarcina sp. BI001-red]REB07981.1 glycerol-3-phosphate acyltransferase [Sporosarcina sp. BI001-red]